jgi:hypothetical protein
MGSQTARPHHCCSTSWIAGIIRILDLMFITKDKDGTISGLEISDSTVRRWRVHRLRRRIDRICSVTRTETNAANAMETGYRGGGDRLREPVGRPVRAGRAQGRRPAGGVRPHPVQALLASLEAAEART